MITTQIEKDLIFDINSITNKVSHKYYTNNDARNKEIEENAKAFKKLLIAQLRGEENILNTIEKKIENQQNITYDDFSHIFDGYISKDYYSYIVNIFKDIWNGVSININKLASHINTFFQNKKVKYGTIGILFATLVLTTLYSGSNSEVDIIKGDIDSEIATSAKSNFNKYNLSIQDVLNGISYKTTPEINYLNTNVDYRTSTVNYEFDKMLEFAPTTYYTPETIKIEENIKLEKEKIKLKEEIDIIKITNLKIQRDKEIIKIDEDNEYEINKYNNIIRTLYSKRDLISKDLKTKQKYFLSLLSASIWKTKVLTLKTKASNWQTKYITFFKENIYNLNLDSLLDETEFIDDSIIAIIDEFNIFKTKTLELINKYENTIYGKEIYNIEEELESSKSVYAIIMGKLYETLSPDGVIGEKINSIIENYDTKINKYKTLLEDINTTVNDQKYNIDNYYNSQIENLVNSNSEEFLINNYRIIIGDGIFNIDNKYIGIQKLGQGGNGSVYYAIDIINTKFVIIKKMDKSDKSENEIENLKLVSSDCSEYFTCMLDNFEKDGFSYIVMESLPTYQSMDNNYLTIKERPKILSTLLNNIINGVNKLHSMNITHGDIKLQNIIVDANTGKMKFIDFTTGCTSDESCNKINLFTAQYFHPELYYKFGNSEMSFNDYVKDDKWAIGIIIYKIITDKFPSNSYNNNLREYMESYSFLEDPNKPIIEEYLKNLSIETNTKYIDINNFLN